MSAKVLRQAARLMRERAEKATPGEWCQVTSAGVGIAPTPISSITIATTHASSGIPQSAADAEHIASWPPAVALAVSEALDQHATDHEHLACRWTPCDHLALARLYIGGES